MTSIILFTHFIVSLNGYDYYNNIVTLFMRISVSLTTKYLIYRISVYYRNAWSGCANIRKQLG